MSERRRIHGWEYAIIARPPEPQRARPSVWWDERRDAQPPGLPEPFPARGLLCGMLLGSLLWIAIGLALAWWLGWI